MTVRGSCLCGAVHYTIDGSLWDAHACHCTQCRKQSGHFIACATASREAVTIQGEEAITWFEATPSIGRGFCAKCGSHLFWYQDGSDTISVNLGSIDGNTDVKLECHIFVADKGDYYGITDGLPEFEGYPGA